MSFTTFFLCLSFFSFILLKPFPSPSFLLLTTCVELMDCFGWTPTTECHLISVPLNRSYVQQNVIGSPLLLPSSSSVEASMNGEMKCACIIESIVSVSPSPPPSFSSLLPSSRLMATKRLGHLPQLRMDQANGGIPRLHTHSCKWTVHSANQTTIRAEVIHYRGDFGEVWSTLVNFIDVCYDD